MRERLKINFRNEFPPKNSKQNYLRKHYEKINLQKIENKFQNIPNPNPSNQKCEFTS